MKALLFSKDILSRGDESAEALIPPIWNRFPRRFVRGGATSPSSPAPGAKLDWKAIKKGEDDEEEEEKEEDDNDDVLRLDALDLGIGLDENDNDEDVV